MKSRTVLALLIAPLMFACGDDDASGPDNETVAGTYILRTVNGQNLPFIIIDQPGYRLEVLSDQYTLNADRTFITAATFRETEDTTVTTSDDTYNGTWQLSAGTMNLTSGGGIETAAFSGGNTLTFTGNGFTVIYRK